MRRGITLWATQDIDLSITTWRQRALSNVTEAISEQDSLPKEGKLQIRYETQDICKQTLVGLPRVSHLARASKTKKDLLAIELHQTTRGGPAEMRRKPIKPTAPICCLSIQWGVPGSFCWLHSQICATWYIYCWHQPYPRPIKCVWLNTRMCEVFADCASKSSAHS